MVQPEVVECERCGQPAPVRSSTPVFDRSHPTHPATAASVVIDCPNCGACTQIVEVNVN